jgi:hypothetical protein
VIGVPVFVGAMSNNLDLNAKVASILKSCEDGVGIVSACKQLISVLMEEKVAYRLTIPPLLVGVHPTNRDGYGINAVDVHTLMDDIFSIGWDMAKVSALCVELTTEDGQSIREFNQRLVCESKGLLAPDHSDQMRFSSLWGGHTNQILRAITCSIPHTNPDMCLGGTLDIQKIEKHDPEFGLAARGGLQWIVIPGTLLKDHPSMASFIQSAGNAPGQVAKPEHEMQLLRKIHNCCLALKKSHQGRVPYDEVKSRVLKSKPPGAQSLPGMFSFVIRHAGGEAASLLMETEAYIRAFSSSMVSLSPDVWDALAVDIKSHKQVSLFRHGLLKAMYTLHESRILHLSDVKKIGGKDMIPKVVAADEMMEQVRGLARANNVPHNVWVEVMGTMDIEMVMFTCDKRHKTVRSVASLGSAAHNAIIAINEKVNLQIDSPWKDDAEVVAQIDATTAANSSDVVMRDFDMDGRVVNPDQHLHEVGFNVGTVVCRKQDKLVGTISVLGALSQVLTQAGDTVEVPVEKLMADWKPTTTSHSAVDEEELCPDDFRSCVADRSISFQTMVHKQELFQQLHQLAQKYPINVDRLKVMVKPKEIYVKHACKKNELVLVPITLKIDHKRLKGVEDVVPTAGIDVGTFDNVVYWLTSSNQQPNSKKNVVGFVAPFWWMATSVKLEDCNMELHSCKDYSIPVARNMVSLKPGDRLVLHRPAKKEAGQQEKSVKPLRGKRKAGD